VQSETDRVLIYLTLYTTECLKELQRCPNKNAGQQKMYSLAISRFDIPGDPGFPLNAVYAKPASSNEAGEASHLPFFEKAPLSFFSLFCFLPVKMCIIEIVGFVLQI
jgi:hypothetical protein